MAALGAIEKRRGARAAFKTPAGKALETSAQRPLDEPLLDAAAAARLLSVRPSWVYEAVREGRLPHLKVGRHVRFLRTDLEAWVLEIRREGRR